MRGEVPASVGSALTHSSPAATYINTVLNLYKASYIKVFFDSELLWIEYHLVESYIGIMRPNAIQRKSQNNSDTDTMVMVIVKCDKHQTPSQSMVKMVQLKSRCQS